MTPTPAHVSATRRQHPIPTDALHLAAPGVPYDFSQEYPPPGGPSEFHHPPPPMYRTEVNPVAAPAPAPMPTQPNAGHGGRPLNNSKRAEQNRKAQRAFRERRDQCVSLARLFIYLDVLTGSSGT